MSEARKQARGQLIADYVATAPGRNFPPEVIDAAKIALVDHVGCAVGASRESGTIAARKATETWHAQGNARIFNGPKTTAALAAMANGTMAHYYDFDDTHLNGGGHISAAVWSAALALGADRGMDEKTTLTGFITGFEVMARIGDGGINGIGRNLQRRNIHPTGVLGSVGAAATAAAMLGLDEKVTKNALGAAATSGSGLVASFGTDSKPFHPGKGAMEGILAVDLAASGFVAAHHLFEAEGGMIDAFIQDRKVEVPELDFTGWELNNNGYKPFACCRATHASIQAAHSLKEKIAGRPIKRITVKVHATAPFTAGKKAPKTPLECKFSVPFCIAMGLNGYRGVQTDFNYDTIADPKVQQIVPTVEMIPIADQPQRESYLDVWLEDGEHFYAETKCFLGHPDFPMSVDDMHVKFQSLVDPIFGASRSSELFDVLMAFDRPGSLKRVVELTGEV